MKFNQILFFVFAITSAFPAFGQTRQKDYHNYFMAEYQNVTIGGKTGSYILSGKFFNWLDEDKDVRRLYLELDLKPRGDEEELVHIDTGVDVEARRVMAFIGGACAELKHDSATVTYLAMEVVSGYNKFYIVELGRDTESLEAHTRFYKDFCLTPKFEQKVKDFAPAARALTLNPEKN